MLFSVQFFSYIFEKPVRQPLMASNGSSINNPRLLINDSLTNLTFLIDTGAQISVLPNIKNESPPQHKRLYAANGSIIPTFGHETLDLNLGLRRKLTWTFTIAAVDQAIIGADFLDHYGLLVDIKNKKLIDTVTNIFVIGKVRNVDTVISIKTLNIFAPYYDVLSHFPKINKKQH